MMVCSVNMQQDFCLPLVTVSQKLVSKPGMAKSFLKCRVNMIYMLESKEKCCLFCVARTDTQSRIQVQRERAGSS